jgi:hypothetical protein
MQPRDLIDTAHDVASDMVSCQRTYKYLDTQLDNENWEEAHSAWRILGEKGGLRARKEGEAKRNKFRLDTEDRARTLISKANSVRSEIISRLLLLPTGSLSAKDKAEQEWFEHPPVIDSKSASNSQLYRLAGHAGYLDSLADRFASERADRLDQ